MKLIVCTDEAFGMAWGKKRQSRDAEVIKRINAITDELCVNAYSLELFPNAKVAPDGEFYFAEIDLPDGTPDEIYHFNWNRLYPHDLTLDIDFNDYELLRAEEFAGNSHKKITLSHYRRK